MELILFLTPWLAVGLFAALFVRIPRELAPRSLAPEDAAPLVSIIIPARNEEANIGACLSSLAASEYPAFEIVVVDDQSQDQTAAIVTEAPQGNAQRVLLIRGETLPEGWFGKPWACQQGALQARGELLLFADADTVHDPLLLGQAVAQLQRDGTDVLTLIGRQVMESFWERLLQPQFFMLLAFRFPRTGTPKKPHQWREAIANGQYLFFRREVYEGLGGHEAVKEEVVEDMRLAQLLVQGGWNLGVWSGEGLRTRMYHSLPHLVEGWSKNITTGTLQSTPRWLHPVVLPLSLVVGTTLWLVPPGVLAWSVATGTGGTLLLWSLLVTGFSILYWGLGSVVMKSNPLYGLLYPLGSVLSAYIFLLSWWRGSHIQWKDRSYSMAREVRRGGGQGPMAKR